MGTNIVWAHISPDRLDYFTWILAILSISTWFKLGIRIQTTERFGPMFKVILSMAGDLGIFYALWFIILMSLTSVATLIFLELPEY